MPINKSLKEKNENDYFQMTERINEALKTLRDDHRIPATQNTLATMSGCSRKTLHNRAWAIKELKEIKQARKSKDVENITETSVNLKTKAQIRENLLIEENENLQEQNAILFNKLQESEYHLSQTLKLNSILEAENSYLRKNEKSFKNGLIREIKTGD